MCRTFPIWPMISLIADGPPGQMVPRPLLPDGTEIKVGLD